MKKPPCPQRGVAPSRTASSSHAKSRFLRNLSFVLLLLALSWIAQAEPLKIKQWDHVSWSHKDGAPSGIYSLAAGADGTLWIGTASGLYQFDGIHFTLFASQPGEINLPTREVRTVCVAKDGTVWVGFITRGIASIRNGHARLYGSQNGLPEGQVSQILEAPDGTIWAVGHHLFHLQKDQWIDEAETDPWQDEDVRTIRFDSRGTLWAATRHSIYFRPFADRKFRSTGLKTSQIVTDMLSAPDGSVWVATQTPNPEPGWLWRIGYGPSGYFKQFRTLVNVATNSVFATSDSFWLGTNEGIMAIVEKSGTTKGGADSAALAITVDRYAHVDGLSAPVVDAATRDKAGNLWFATSAGLDRFKLPILTRFVDKPGEATRPSSDFNFVAGNNHGPVWMIDTSNMPLTSVDRGKVIAHGPSQEYHAIFCDQEGGIWLDSTDGLTEYNNNHFRHFPLPEETREQVEPIHQMVEIDAHHLYVSLVQHGLWMFGDDGSWQKITIPGVSGRRPPMAMFYDQHKVLWAGYIDGTIIRVDGQHVEKLASPELGLGSIQVFAESRVGFLVGGANGLALIQNSVPRLLPMDNLAAMRGLSGIVEADNGDIWINGLGGVFRLPKDELMAAARTPGYLIHPEPILLDNGPLASASQIRGLPTAVKDSGGRIWFANLDEITSVDPNRFSSNPAQPLVSMRTIASEVGSSKTLSDPVFARAHTLRIGYFGTNLSDPEGVVYRYKLDNIDKDWQEVGSRTEAVYTDLPAGRYRFHVAGSNRGGKWSDSPVEQEFTILPAFYETVWFRAICVLLGLGIVWLLFTLRVTYISARVRERSEERANERVRIARDLHDTLLQGVQALMWRFQIAAHELPEESKTRGALDSALGSAETVLSEARERVKSLREMPSGAGDLASALALMGNELNWTGSVAFRVETRGNAYPLAPAVQEELFSVAREALTNSFRHSQASEVTVEITYGRKSVVLSCRDNGCGMSPDVLKEGVAGHWGLLGMRERASKLGATLECWSTVGSGTEVLLRVSLRGAKFRRMLLNWT